MCNENQKKHPSLGAWLFGVLVAGGVAAVLIQFLLPKLWPENKPPVAQIVTNTTKGPAPLVVTFNGANSSDPEGKELTFEWLIDGNRVSTESNFTKTFNIPKSHNIELRIKDHKELQNAKSVIIEVLPTPTPTGKKYQVVTNIPVGKEPSGVAVAFSPNGERAYVISDGPVSVIDTNNNQMMTTISVGRDSSGIAVSPNGRVVYVADNDDGIVRIIDTVSNQVIGSILLERGLTDLAFVWESKKLYVTSDGSHNVSVIDTYSREVDTVPLGSRSSAVVGTADGWAYVASFFDDNVNVIDAGKRKVVATIQVGDQPKGMAITPDGARVYVVNGGSDNVCLIDTTSNMVMATIPVGKNPIAMAITRDGKWAYVVNSGSNDVSVIDTASNTVVTAILVGTRPCDVAVTQSGAQIYVANGGSDTVSVITVE